METSFIVGINEIGMMESLKPVSEAVIKLLQKSSRALLMHIEQGCLSLRVFFCFRKIVTKVLIKEKSAMSLLCAMMLLFCCQYVARQRCLVNS